MTSSFVPHNGLLPTGMLYLSRSLFGGVVGGEAGVGVGVGEVLGGVFGST